jgi:predicted dehydrogenase
MRIGLFGTGFMGTIHAERYREMDDADVAAVASPSGAAGFVAEHAPDAAAYDDATALLDAAADLGLDAVDVCTPTPTHRELVEAAAARGLDALCEKPLALTLADATAMAEAAAAAGTTLMVAHVVRFFPAYRALRDALVDGTVGDVERIHARRVSPFPDWSDWFADEDRSGGLFHDLAIHELDFCRWAVGPVDRVFARSAERGGRPRGHATLRFANGAVGTVEAGWDRPSGGDLHSAVEVAGTAGRLAHDSAGDAPVRLTDDEGTATDPAEGRDGYRRQLDAFVRCVREGEEPPVGVDEGIAAVRLALATRRSAARGEPVAVADVEVGT